MLELKGIPCINADQAPAPRKTLVSSRSFGKKIYEKKHLQEALALHATRAGERLRAEKLKAGGISIHLRTSRHGEKSIYNKTYAVDFTDLSDDTGHFIKSTQIALDKIFKPNFAYAKAGVMLYKLSTTGQIEKSLFDLLKNEKKIEARHKLMNAMDKINKSFGRDTLRFAAEGSDSEPWHMQRNFSSPAYTTRWEDLKEIL